MITSETFISNKLIIQTNISINRINKNLKKYDVNAFKLWSKKSMHEINIFKKYKRTKMTNTNLIKKKTICFYKDNTTKLIRIINKLNSI